MNQMSDKYIGTTASSLDHYFGNHIGIVRLWHLEGLMTKDFDSCKRNFIEGLERTIGENLPEYAGITNQHLRQMIQVAQQGDLSNIDTVKTLYKTYYKIKKDPFDEQKLFGKK
ncbi:hypothetical protein HYZ41_04525 [archaeon]|nr:hypothetical protein [archaeon]